LYAYSLFSIPYSVFCIHIVINIACRLWLLPMAIGYTISISITFLFTSTIGIKLGITTSRLLVLVVYLLLISY